MKNLFILLAGLLFFPAGKTLAQGKQTPTEYNNKIVGIQATVINDILELSATFEARKASEMDKKYAELKKSTEQAVTDISKLSGYDGSTELRDAAKELFVFYKETVAKEYAEMIKILKKPDSEVTEADIKRIDNISEVISVREKVLDERFANAQNKFAEKYNFAIEENKLQKEIDNMSK